MSSDKSSVSKGRKATIPLLISANGEPIRPRVDKNVPLVVNRIGRQAGDGLRRYLPFDELEPGDSFFVPEGWAGRTTVKKIRVMVLGMLSARRRGNKYTKPEKLDKNTYSVAIVEENGVPGVRCWRLS